MKWLFLLLLTLCIAPQVLSASILVEKDRKHEATWEKFNTAVNDKTAEIKGLVFGPITKMVGMLGIAYGVIMMLVRASPTPLITYGGIGLLLNVIPYFIDSIFGAILPW